MGIRVSGMIPSNNARSSRKLGKNTRRLGALLFAGCGNSGTDSGGSPTLGSPTLTEVCDVGAYGLAGSDSKSSQMISISQLHLLLLLRHGSGIHSACLENFGSELFLEAEAC